jgi:glycosyltransferase involved in cell wall biosynthesis
MSDKNSIFVVTSGNLKDGVPEIQNFMRIQVEFLKRAGWRVCLSIVDDRTSLRGVLRNFRRIRKELVEAKSELVHAQYGSVTAAIAYGIKGRLPLVVTFRGDDLLGTPNPGLLWRVRERCAHAIGLAVAYGAAAIVVVSANLLAALPVPMRRKAVVIPNGIDMDWFKPLNKLHARARLGWSEEAKVVLFNASVSGNQTVKNLPLALATIDILSQSVPRVVLQQLANASWDDVRSMMNAADCLLVTSLHEGSPDIVKEAMACNLPVVSVPCGDVVERLKGTCPGEICPYDAYALAGAIEEVLKAGCRSNGREQLISQGLSATSIAKRMDRLYTLIRQGNSVSIESHERICAE